MANDLYKLAIYLRNKKRETRKVKSTSKIDLPILIMIIILISLLIALGGGAIAMVYQKYIKVPPTQTPTATIEAAELIQIPDIPLPTETPSPVPITPTARAMTKVPDAVVGVNQVRENRKRFLATTTATPEGDAGAELLEGFASQTVVADDEGGEGDPKATLSPSEGGGPADEGDQPSADDSLSVFVSVTDPNGVPILGLPSYQFDVFQDGNRLDCETGAAETGLDVLFVVLVFDSSTSMEGVPLQEAQQAAIQFINGLGENAFISLISFDAEVNRLSPFTQNKLALSEQIMNVALGNATRMYDGLHNATEWLQSFEDEQRHAIVLLSDGGDTGSGHPLSETLTYLKHGSVPVFVIGLQGTDYSEAPLQQIAQETGGRYLTTEKPEELAQLYLEVQEQLKAQYELNCTGAVMGDNHDHNLLVLLLDGDSAIMGNKGYYSPP